MRRIWQFLIPALIVGVAVVPWAAGQGFGQGATSALTLEPPTLTVDRGGTASVKITVALRSGKTGGTSLKAWDVPDGLTIRFNPDTGNPPFIATMSVWVTPTGKAGTHMVKIQATGGDPSEVVSYPVIVQSNGGSGGY